MSTAWNILAATVLAAVPMTAQAIPVTTTFDFESGYSDNDPFAAGDVLLKDSTGAVSPTVSVRSGLATMAIEQAGGDDRVPGFVNDSAKQAGDTANAYDTALASESESLGNYFLRTAVALSGALPPGAPIFSLAFDGGVTAVTAQIWDIDGTSELGTEGWNVVANRAGGATSSILSPVFAVNTTSQTPIESLDAQAWQFAFDDTGGAIESIDFFFTGTKIRGIGVAFDNLVVTQDNAGITTAPVPLPASVWMLLAAVGGMAAMRRLRA